jgi:Protein of unknown function (DUF3147)
LDKNVIVKLNAGSVRITTWSEYATRFVFGGTVTLLAGLIADKFGPGVGGLFLAFPAIFPASASLIEKHQREKKRRAGLDGEKRGRLAAGVDAAGAAMGCLGLAVFAAAAWKVLPHVALWATLTLATALWVITAFVAWFVCRRFR